MQRSASRKLFNSIKIRWTHEEFRVAGKYDSVKFLSFSFLPFLSFFNEK